MKAGVGRGRGRGTQDDAGMSVVAMPSGGVCGGGVARRAVWGGAGGGAGWGVEAGVTGVGDVVPSL